MFDIWGDFLSPTTELGELLGVSNGSEKIVVPPLLGDEGPGDGSREGRGVTLCRFLKVKRGPAFSSEPKTYDEERAQGLKTVVDLDASAPWISTVLSLLVNGLLSTIDVVLPLVALFPNSLALKLKLMGERSKPRPRDGEGSGVCSEPPCDAPN